MQVRTPAELQALAQARALLPGGNTVDVLEQLPASILELLEPTNIYTCELAAQYIFVVYGRTRVLAQASTKPEPGSREEEFNNYVKRVHSELHRLFFHATAADGQPLCCEGERLLATKAAQEGWSGEWWGIYRLSSEDLGSFTIRQHHWLGLGLGFGLGHGCYWVMSALGVPGHCLIRSHIEPRSMFAWPIFIQDAASKPLSACAI
jgi:hypothetical protein